MIVILNLFAFGAEEVGLNELKLYFLNSLSPDDSKNTIAMINADMVGIGDKLCVYTLDKNAKSLTADLAVSCMNSFKYENTRNESSGSDHVAFRQYGIPVAYFEYSPDLIIIQMRILLIK